MFSTENLSLWCGQRALIQNLSITIENYDLAVLMGPSGLGKTTLLRILVGVYDGETISLRGSIRNYYSAIQLQRGYIAQNEKLIPWLTVQRNIELPFSLCPSISHRVSRKEMDNLINLLEIDSIQKKSAAVISGGEAQRVLLARTILNCDKVLVLDEPWSHLDAPLRRRMLPALRTWLKHNGYSALVVVHEPEDTVHFCTKTFVLGSTGSIAAEVPFGNVAIFRERLFQSLFREAMYDSNAA